MKENGSMPRRRVVMLGVLLLILFLASGVSVGFVARGADTIFRKERFTNFCSECGIQRQADFYYVFDSETLRLERILGLSRTTMLPESEPHVCDDNLALIGRRTFSIRRDGTIRRSARGRPEGDTLVAVSRVKKGLR